VRSEIGVLDLRGEVERRGFVYPVDGVDVAFLVREDMFEDIGGSVLYAGKVRDAGVSDRVRAGSRGVGQEGRMEGETRCDKRERCWVNREAFKRRGGRLTRGVKLFRGEAGVSCVS
jgi:hypothetical protein